MKKLIIFTKKISIFLFAIILTLFFIEVFLKYFYPQNLSYTMFDENLMYKHVPNLQFYYSRQEFNNTIKFNSKGLRDYEYDYKKADNVYRILVLGDSTPEALQVQLDQTFIKLLERMLNEQNRNKSHKYEVINAGVGGYGTEQEMIFFEIEGVKYQPDAIILEFSSNDIEDNYYSPVIELDKGLIRKNLVTISTPKRFMLWCSIHFNFCSMAQTVLLHGLKKNTFFRSLLSKIRISSSKVVYTRFEPNDIYHIYPSAIFKKALNDTLIVISNMSNFAKANDIAFAILIRPSAEQVDRGQYIRFIKNNNINESHVDIDKIQKILNNYSRENNIPIINLLPYFKSKNKNNTFYFDIDGHWNVQGHKLVADVLYNEKTKYILK